MVSQDELFSIQRRITTMSNPCNKKSNPYTFKPAKMEQNWEPCLIILVMLVKTTFNFTKHRTASTTLDNVIKLMMMIMNYYINKPPLL